MKRKYHFYSTSDEQNEFSGDTVIVSEELLNKCIQADLILNDNPEFRTTPFSLRKGTQFSTLALCGIPIFNDQAMAIGIHNPRILTGKIKYLGRSERYRKETLLALYASEKFWFVFDFNGSRLFVCWDKGMILGR